MIARKSRIKLWYENNFLEAEFGISVAVGVATAILFQYFLGSKALKEAMDMNRLYLYSTIAAICGSLLGFVITEASIIIVFGGTPLAKPFKDENHLKTVFNINFQAVKWLGITCTWMIICIVLDTDKHPHPWAVYVGIGLACLAFLRVYRCVWVLKGITTKICQKENISSDQVD